MRTSADRSAAEAGTDDRTNAPASAAAANIFWAGISNLLNMKPFLRLGLIERLEAAGSGDQGLKPPHLAVCYKNIPWRQAALEEFDQPPFRSANGMSNDKRHADRDEQIGRTPWRERGCQYV